MIYWGGKLERDLPCNCGHVESEMVEYLSAEIWNRMVRDWKKTLRREMPHKLHVRIGMVLTLRAYTQADENRMVIECGEQVKDMVKMYVEVGMSLAQRRLLQRNGFSWVIVRHLSSLLELFHAPPVVGRCRNRGD
jgi:hypothetical protein